MNILTFDIEEWAIAKASGYGTKEKYAEYDKFLNNILSLLKIHRIKATFFCTGVMATDFPHVVKHIHSQGHEIGCHSHKHTWMNKLSESEAKEDTHMAVDALEQCIGQKVYSYRAPAFSIGENNKWMFNILADNGITRDSSIFPAARDFGGFKEFSSQKPCVIEHDGIKIHEFPISLTDCFGRKIAYSGGGYFRMFPYCFIRNRIIATEYNMAYFHISDLLPEFFKVLTRKEYESYFKEPGSLKNRYLRYFKSNIGRNKASAKLKKFISSFPFDNCEQADEYIDWDSAPIVNFSSH